MRIYQLVKACRLLVSNSSNIEKHNKKSKQTDLATAIPLRNNLYYEQAKIILKLYTYIEKATNMDIILLQCDYAIYGHNENIKWISLELKERKRLPFI